MHAMPCRMRRSSSNLQATNHKVAQKEIPRTIEEACVCQGSAFRKCAWLPSVGNAKHGTGTLESYRLSKG
jgi:hypothetical protein